LHWQSFDTWFSVLKVVVGLGLVIFVHELGHFVVAKMCGVKCEKFYIGFDVPIRLGVGRFSVRSRRPLETAVGRDRVRRGIIPWAAT